MKHLTHLIFAAFAVVILSSGTARAFETLDEYSCTVEYKQRHDFFNTHCLVRGSMSQGFFREEVTIPGGKKFRIDGDEGTGEYKLDGKKAKMTRATNINGEATGRCYENKTVYLCYPN